MQFFCKTLTRAGRRKLVVMFKWE